MISSIYEKKPVGHGVVIRSYGGQARTKVRNHSAVNGRSSDLVSNVYKSDFRSE